MYTTSNRSAGKRVLAIMLAFMMFASMGLDVVAAEVMSSVAKSSVELKVTTAEIFNAIQSNIPAVAEKNITTLEEAMAEISENGVGEISTVKVVVKNDPQKLIYDENGALIDSIPLEDEVIEEAFLLEPKLADYVENTLVLPGAEGEKSVISKTELLSSIEGHLFVKAEEGENWQALFTLNPSTMEVEVFFANNTQTNLNVKIKIYDEEGNLLNTSEIASTIYTLEEEVLTTAELEAIKAQGFKTELLKIEETQKNEEDVKPAPAGENAAGAENKEEPKEEVKEPGEEVEEPKEDTPPAEEGEGEEPSGETPEAPVEETPPATEEETPEADETPAPEAEGEDSSVELPGGVEVTTAAPARSLLTLVNITAQEEAPEAETKEEAPAEETEEPKEDEGKEKEPATPETEDEDAEPAPEVDGVEKEADAEKDADSNVGGGVQTAEVTSAVEEAAPQVLTALILKDETLKTSEKAGVISASVPAQTVMATSLTFSLKTRAFKYTVTFKAGDTIISTLPVEENGTVNEPVAPNPLDYGAVSFRGWYLNEGELNETLFDFSTKITSNLTVTAKFSDKYLIKYKESPTGSVIDTKELAPGEIIPRTSVEVSAPAGNHISYWYVEGSTPSGGHYPQFEFGSEKADSDITLVPYFSNAYLVLFISEGTQVNPQTIASGSSAAEPTAPTRVGYTFSHWSLTKDGAKYNFNTNKITANTTLYAVWTPQSVSYTLVYWFEKPNVVGDAGDNWDNYEFFKTVTTKKALAGSTPDFTASQLDAIAYGTYYKTVSEPILGNGISVVNVYFKRTVYTFKFNLNVDYAKTMKVGTTTYTKTGTSYSFQAKLGQNVEALWPIEITNVASFTSSSSGYSFYGWLLGTTTFVTKRIFVTEDMLTGNVNNTITYNANIAQLVEREVSYYLQALPHQLNDPGVVTYDGVKYIKDNDLSQKYKSPSNNTLNPKTLQGFETGVRKSGESGNTVYNFYYKRKANTFSFNTVGGNTISPKTNIMYEQKLNDQKPADPTRSGYTFAGWYYDSKYRNAFDFNTATMPNSSLEIFAKWESTANTISFFNSTKDVTPVHTQGVANGGYVDNTNMFYTPGQVVEGRGEFVEWQWQVSNQWTKFPLEMPIAQNYSLYAKWKTEEFTLTYNKGLGKVGSVVPVDSDKYDIGTQARLKGGTTLVAPDGEVFIGWKKTGDTTMYYQGSLLVMNGSTEVVAQYGKTVDYLKLVFDANHAELPDQQVEWLLKKDDETNLFDGGTWATVEDELIGWNSSKVAAQAGTVEYSIGQTYKMGSTNKTFYAVWKTKKVTVNFTYGSGGHLSGKTEYKGIAKGTVWGTAITAVPNPVADAGYYFAGWSPAIPSSTYAITKNETYVASFAAQTNVTIFAESITKTYDGIVLLPSSIITSGSLKGTDTLEEVKYSTAGITEVGFVNYLITSYKIMRGNADVTAEYNVTLMPGTLTIEPLAVNLSDLKIKDATKVYGDADPDYVIEGWPTGLTAADFNITFDRTDKGENVGVYTDKLTAVVTPKSTNLVTIGAVKPGTLTITKKAVTITVNPKTKVYGDADPVFDGTVSGVVAGDDLKVAYKRTDADKLKENVGDDITLTATYTANGNYTVTINTAKLIITKKPAQMLRLIVKDAGKVYGPAYTTFEFENWYATGLDIKDFEVSFTRTDPTNQNVGAYTINATLKDKTGNHDISNITIIPGTFTISPYPLTVKVADEAKVYDGNPLVPSKLTDPNIVLPYGDKIDVASLVFTGSQTEVGASSSTATGVTVKNGTDDKTGNYSITVNPGELKVTTNTIDLETLNVKVKDETKVYGDAEPTYVFENWPASIPQADFVITIGREDEVRDAGVYTDKVLATVVPKTDNYTVVGTVKPGTLTITQRDITIKVKDETKVYDGTALLPKEVEISGGALYYGDQIDKTSLVLSGTQTDAGNSPSSVSGLIIRAGLVRLPELPVKTQNYNITFANGNLEVIQATLDLSDLKVKDETITYGDAEPSYVIENWPVGISKDQFTVTIERADKVKDAGIYTDKVIAVVTPKNDNYTVINSVKPGTLTIKPKAVTIAVHGKSKVEGQGDPVFTGTVSGLLGTDDLAVVYKRADADAGKNKAGDNITLTAIFTPNSNYEVTIIEAKLTITKGGNNGDGDPDNESNTGGGGGGSTTIVDEETPTTIIEDTPIPTTNLPETGRSVAKLGSLGNLVVGYAALLAALRKKDEGEEK